MKQTAALLVPLLVVLAFIWLSADEGSIVATIDARVRAATETAGYQSPAGEGPWNPYEFGGRPRIADPQTFLYPPVLRRWVSDAWLTLVSYVLHLWVAAVAVYLAARRLKVGLLAAVALSLAYLFATVLAVPMSRVSAEIVFRCTWLPLLGTAMLSLADSGTRWQRIVAVMSGLVIAGAGSPRTLAYGGATLVGTSLLFIVWASGRRRHVAARIAAVVTLMVTVGAPLSFPALRLWRSTHRNAGLMSSEPFNGSWRAVERVALHPALAQALRELRPARVISMCPEVVDVVHLRALGIRTLGGYGGVFSGGYARFINLIRNQTITASLPYTALEPGDLRTDLLQFLDPEYLVSCGAARGELVRTVESVGIYKIAPVLGAAVWTCYPNRVSRREAEYRLATRRYDRTLSLREPGPKINVRWAPDADDVAREAAEVRFHLVQEGQPDGRTRRYELLDPSRANVEALLANPIVEDTAGLNRATLVFDKVPEVRFDGRQTHWLIGLEPCPEVRSASIVTRTAGHVVVDVDAPGDGVVVFSETFYRTRTALVDKKPAAVLEVNLAFSAVPVPPGRHRVELGVRSDVQRLDWVCAFLGLAGVAGSLWRDQRPLNES